MNGGDEQDLRRRLQARQARDPEGMETAVAHSDLGQHLLDVGALAEAEAHLALAHAGFVRHFGSDHPFTLSCLVNAGVAVRAQGRLADALPMFTAVAQARMAQLGPHDPLTRNALMLVEDVQAQLGHPHRRW